MGPSSDMEALVALRAPVGRMGPEGRDDLYPMANPVSGVDPDDGEPLELPLDFITGAGSGPYGNEAVRAFHFADHDGFLSGLVEGPFSPRHASEPDVAVGRFIPKGAGCKQAPE